MTLEEISDGPYFVKEANHKKNVYKKIRSNYPIPGEIHGITVQELSVGLNNAGFSQCIWESSVRVIPISKKEAYDKYIEKTRNAIKKHEENLKVLRELLNFLNS